MLKYGLSCVKTRVQRSNREVGHAHVQGIVVTYLIAHPPVQQSHKRL